MHQSRGEPKIENHYSYLLSGVPILSVVLIPGPSYPWFESSSSRLVVPSPSSLLPVFKGWLIIALYSLAACYCLTCTRLGYRPSSKGWEPGDGSEVDVGKTGSKTLDDTTQLFDVTSATVPKICLIVTLIFSRMIKAKRNQKTSMVGEV